MDDADPTGELTGSTGATSSAGALLVHPVRVALAAVDAAVGELAAANLWSMSDHELLTARIDAEATRRRLDAAVLAMTREIDGRGAAVRAGASSTAAWLRGCCRQRPAVAHGEVRLAAELDRDLPALAAALAAGHVSHESARVVADTVRALPAAVDAATRARGEAFLVDQARRYDAAAVATLGRHLAARLDPTEGAELEREEALREEAEAFTVTHDIYGRRRVTGRLTPEHGATLDAALDVLAAPTKGSDGEPDPRSAEKRRADALMLLVSRGLASEHMPCTGGEAVTMTVITTPEHLQQISGGDQTRGAGRWRSFAPPARASGRPGAAAVGRGVGRGDRRVSDGADRGAAGARRRPSSRTAPRSHPRPPAGSAATPGWSPRSSTPPASCSTSAAGPGSSRRRCAGR